MVSSSLLPLFRNLSRAFNERDAGLMADDIDLPVVFIGDNLSAALTTRAEAERVFRAEFRTLEQKGVVGVSFRPISETASSQTLTIVKTELVLTYRNGNVSDPRYEHVIVRSHSDGPRFAAIVGPQIFDAGLGGMTSPDHVETAEAE